MATEPERNDTYATLTDAKKTSRVTDKLWTPANIITLARVCLVPLFVIVLVCPWPEWFNVPSISISTKRYLAAAIFIVISCTDWLDGYLARSRNEVTDFGKFMDPLADKILVAAALLALIELGSLPSWVALVILAREFIVSGVRMVAASTGVVIAACDHGQFQTVFQMIALVLFTIKDAHGLDPINVALGDGLWVLSWTIMIIALILTVVSMLDYIVKARNLIGLGPRNAKLDEASQHDSESGSLDVDDADTESLARMVVEAAEKSNTSLGTAESLTGGLIASTLTSIPGSSAVVRGGIVSYVNDIKNGLLGVDADVLAEQGAVCADVAEQMALGAKKQLGCTIAVSVTGIAGPTGAEEGKPIGTVYLGVASPYGLRSMRFNFAGDRSAIRNQTVYEALRVLLGEISNCALSS